MDILDGGPNHAWYQHSVPYWSCFMAQMTHPFNKRLRGL
jgi:hypothetical protein